MIKPLISIAVCTYNGESFVAEQLQSLVNQTYTNLEIIIVDDGSSDDTLKIVALFAAQCPAIKIYNNVTNLGYVKNFEKAISLCTGDFIALCDQDDVWELDKISKLLNHIGKHALIYHDSAFINADGSSLNKRLSDRLNMYEGNHPEPFFLYNCISGHSLMFRRDLLKKILPFDERFYHDWQMAIIATENGGICYLDQPLVQYRQHHLSNTDFLRIKKKKGYKRPKKKDIINYEWLLFIKHRLAPSTYLNQFISCLSLNEQGVAKNSSKLFSVLLKKYKLIFYIKKKVEFLKIIKAIKVAYR